MQTILLEGAGLVLRGATLHGSAQIPPVALEQLAGSSRWLPAAAGSQQPTSCVCAWLPEMQEVSTMLRYNTNPLIILINNGG
jgi:hypothetical protein